ncbi:MAG TPA: hypothetical protein VIO84_14200 [Candidatus Dormibacteraeota bacterium]
MATILFAGFSINVFNGSLYVGSLAAAPVVGRFGFDVTLLLSTVACLAAAPVVLTSIRADPAT